MPKRSTPWNPTHILPQLHSRVRLRRSILRCHAAATYSNVRRGQIRAVVICIQHAKRPDFACCSRFKCRGRDIVRCCYRSCVPRGMRVVLHTYSDAPTVFSPTGLALGFLQVGKEIRKTCPRPRCVLAKCWALISHSGHGEGLLLIPIWRRAHQNHPMFLLLVP